MSDLMDTMRALQKGERTVEDVAAEFRTRSWPTVQVTPEDADAAFAAEQTDRDPDPPGAFSEVAGAFYQGIITIDQYGALAEAAAEGMRSAADDVEESTDDVSDDDGDDDGDTEDAEGDTDAADNDTEDEPAPGKPKKGVNPFPKKDE